MITNVDEWSCAEMGTGASIASISQGKNTTCAALSQRALTKPKHQREGAPTTLNPKITRCSSAGAFAARASKPEDPTWEYRLADAQRKARSPTCEIVKTFKAAFMVWTRIDQKRTRKNEVMLIHSQKKINVTRSNEQKKIKASCEKREERRVMATPLTSYSKYSLRKTKQSINARRRMLLKWQLSSSQQRVNDVEYSAAEPHDATK
jgi:hypothetical protein